jgi:uncharacterized protein (DUF1697 family)
VSAALRGCVARASCRWHSGGVRYVALMRGVNVGGVRIQMADLRTLLTATGFASVATVLASGNVLFDLDEGDPREAQRRMEQAVGERFEYRARILVLPADEVRSAAAAYPHSRAEGKHAYLIFAEDPATAEAVAAESPSSEEDLVAVRGSVVYWEVAKGRTLDSPFGAALAKRKGAFLTTRNLQTIEKILKAV